MLTTSILLALGLSLSSASPLQVPSHVDLIPQTHSRFKAQAGRETISPSDNFWFGSFDVGRSKNLTLLVDTGSADIILNDGVYKPGPGSVKVGREFNLTFGSTNSDGSGSGTVTGPLINDTVRFGKFSTQQAFGLADPQEDGSNLIPGDGIIGFGYPSNINLESTFFHTLCAQHKVSECRFGLTLGREKGTQVLGTLDKSLFEGELVTTTILQEWIISADLAVDGKIIQNDVIVLLDSGTGTIIAPVSDVVSLFERMNIQHFVQKSDDLTTVTGYFPCDQPPSLGLSIPSKSNITSANTNKSNLTSRKASVFDIPPEQWIKSDNGNNNCTAIVSGTSAVPDGLWVVGQPFFHDIYIDHNVADQTVGFAKARA
ncbi:acid protease [Penicillium brevicompactum]|uniref:Acid protease n=1 Tax=Penicillium brevicompactum TaxID=5074 RepID=A0A9W9UGZ7_PENBR|nr:acid protease [Penicillium brevicompactum]